MSNVPRTVVGKYCGRYPDRVIRNAAKRYQVLGDTGKVAKELGLKAEIVRYWRSRYAWKKPLTPLAQLPTKWACECGRKRVRDLDELPACPCGRQPKWAA